MKLNGASKPRQGASKQGSSPGVVLNKYRIKRYYKVNENEVNGLPLNACALNKKLYITENISNSNNICINNPQQKTPAATLTQQKQKGKCDEKYSNSSMSRRDYSASTTNKNSTTPNTIETRVSAVRRTKAFCSYLTRRVNKNNILQTKLAIAAEAVADVATARTLKNNNKGEKTFEIDLKQRAAINITTRQIKKATLSKECGNNKNNNDTNCGEKNRKQVNIVKTTTLDFSNNHVTFNRSHNTNNNNNSATKRVNKFPLILKMYESLYLTAIISRLLIQFKLLLFFMFSHAIKHLTRNPFAACGGSGGGRGTARVRGRTSTICCRSCGHVGNNLAKIMRASQSLEGSFGRICFKNASKIRLPSSIALCMVIYAAAAILLPQPVVGDDGDSFFPSNGLETTTPEFDYASRGQKKFGDKCDNTLECGFPGSICDPKKKSCQCTEDLPVTNHIDKCGKEAAVNETCFFNEQCEVKYFQTECRDQRCVCRFDMTPVWLKDGSVECKGRGDKKGPETYIDPAMIGVLIGMALMFIIICVVLRLFSQARWRENRTIFNTPNPRLMNVSLLRESKLLHGQERRGSRMSVRAPSRQPSMASLRPHSPNPSLGKTGSGSNSHGSNASVTSLRSTRSNSVSPAGIVGNNSHHERKGSTYQPHQHHQPTHQKLQPPAQQHHEQQPLTQTHIISNPVAETVTVEIIEPEK